MSINNILTYILYAKVFSAYRQYTWTYFQLNKINTPCRTEKKNTKKKYLTELITCIFHLIHKIHIFGDCIPNLVCRP